MTDWVGASRMKGKIHTTDEIREIVIPIEKRHGVWNTMMIDLPVLKQKCQSSLEQK